MTRARVTQRLCIHTRLALGVSFSTIVTCALRFMREQITNVLRKYRTARNIFVTKLCIYVSRPLEGEIVKPSPLGYLNDRKNVRKCVRKLHRDLQAFCYSSVFIMSIKPTVRADIERSGSTGSKGNGTCTRWKRKSPLRSALLMCIFQNVCSNRRGHKTYFFFKKDFRFYFHYFFSSDLPHDDASFFPFSSTARPCLFHLRCFQQISHLFTIHIRTNDTSTLRFSRF